MEFDPNELDAAIEGAELTLKYLDGRLLEVRDVVKDFHASGACGKCPPCRITLGGLYGQITEIERLQSEVSADLDEMFSKRGY